MLRKKMYTWFLGGFYTRQAEADYYIYRRSSPSAPHRLFQLWHILLPVRDSECSDMLRPPTQSPHTSVRAARRVG